jgi:hypothetical protein
MRKKNQDQDQLKLNLAAPKSSPIPSSQSANSDNLSGPTATIYNLDEIHNRRARNEQHRHVESIIELVRRYE